MTTMKRNAWLRQMVLAALFLALCLLLPFLTGQIPEIGSLLLPMHFPVFLCGFVCGRLWGLAVGFEDYVPKEMQKLNDPVIVEKGDIIIDGGNSNYQDTIRRTAYVESKGLLYIGTGVSGGEEGALIGPSIMPGGSPAAWPTVKPVLQAISAKVEGDVPCCDWVGENGAGHFVKMVHNGIEYGDMQLICETYDLTR